MPMVKKLFICVLERYKLIINRCSNDPTYSANMETTHSKCLSLTFINASAYHARQQSLLQHRVIKEDFLAPYVIHGLETGFVLFYSVNFNYLRRGGKGIYKAATANSIGQLLQYIPKIKLG